MDKIPHCRRHATSFDMPEPGLSAPRRRVLALMFTDIVGSTPLVVALGDERWLETLRRHDALVRSCFRAYSGFEVKHLGDGFFAVFEDAIDAVRCGHEIQRTLAAERRRTSLGVHIRVGIGWAPVLQSGRDWVGRGVHEAARLSKVGGADAIVVTAAALDACNGDLPERARGLVQLRGLPEPIEVASLRPVGTGDLSSLAAL